MSRFLALRRIRTLFLGLLGLSIGCLGIATWTSSAFADPPITSITSCQTITKAGNYEVDSTLTTDKPGDCLVIEASNVTINLNGMAINGSGGAGAGVHVLSSANYAYIEGRGSTIGGFAEGMEIDGSNRKRISAAWIVPDNCRREVADLRQVDGTRFIDEDSRG